jgi:heme oxygenase (biliverdin-IX-beta and delta-forming)
LDLARLRLETRRDHEEVEELMPLMRGDLNRDLYAAVLGRLSGFVEMWERTLRFSIPERLMRFAAERNRATLLTQDLAHLGVTAVNFAHPDLPRFDNLAELLGAMYVMEGSRLGGQLIARHVDAVLGTSAGEASRYFRGFGDETGLKWREFLRILEMEISEQQTGSAIQGAKKMFTAFGAWMRQLELITQESSRD